MILNHLPTLLHLATQEDGSMPGKGLSIGQTLLYFVATPIALFSIIAGIVVIATADHSKGRSSDLSRID